MTPELTWLADIAPTRVAEFGGKAVALARLLAAGHRVPRGFAVPVSYFERHVGESGLRGRLLLELGRKEFADMRWEEMWDASLRIRHLFDSTALSESLAAPLRRMMALLEPPFVVRSSAPHEDSAETSFAGLHASFVNLSNADEVLRDLRAVWSSLFSDAALLYRQELGLDPASSSMAVVVQEMLAGDASGVAFSHNPVNDNEGVIEAAHGLNQGVVDGAVDVDRWFVDRATGAIRHQPATRERRAVPGRHGVTVEPIPETLRARPPLETEQVARLWQTIRAIERQFGRPQDVEWTLAGDDFHLLQARPISTGATPEADPTRAWYLTLRRSRDNLTTLRAKIEKELLPAMEDAAARVGAGNVSTLSDEALLRETERRGEIHQHWVDVYWRDFIPFAHGMRLFGEFHNRRLQPEDPYAFVELLAGTGIRAVQRNERLGALAESPSSDTDIDELLRELGGRFAPSDENVAGFRRLARAIAEGPARHVRDTDASAAAFLERFPSEERPLASELLDLGRASYRLRDDDNIVLGRIEAAWRAAHDEAVRRGLLEPRPASQRERVANEHARLDLETPPHIDESVRGRQLVGQPAGPGWARGPARVITSHSDLFAFQTGEVLVCDAVDPNMTFVVPLAAAVVERRGGMLIHGAIIAREYGIPCVTGVPQVTELLRTGDPLSVDGFLGLVAVQRD